MSGPERRRVGVPKIAPPPGDGGEGRTVVVVGAGAVAADEELRFALEVDQRHA